mmetsp:Transcript_9878/g.17538  ORF Transcript_9878/g.17538 Transcript_9878/m.17538 type:complete len:104 (-) Transcript_9878:1826-2137(-)
MTDILKLHHGQYVAHILFSSHRLLLHYAAAAREITALHHLRSSVSPHKSWRFIPQQHNTTYLLANSPSAEKLRKSPQTFSISISTLRSALQQIQTLCLFHHVY